MNQPSGRIQLKGKPISLENSLFQKGSHLVEDPDLEEERKNKVLN